MTSGVNYCKISVQNETQCWNSHLPNFLQQCDCSVMHVQYKGAARRNYMCTFLLPTSRPTNPIQYCVFTKTILCSVAYALACWTHVHKIESQSGYCLIACNFKYDADFFIIIITIISLKNLYRSTYFADVEFRTVATYVAIDGKKELSAEFVYLLMFCLHVKFQNRSSSDSLLITSRSKAKYSYSVQFNVLK